MIKINMKLCWLAAFLLVVSFVDLSAQCNPSLSADWSGSDTTYDSTLGVNGVTFDSPDEPGAEDTSFSPNGTFNVMNYWSNPAVAGLTSLQYVINWDDTPDGVPDIDGFIDFTDPAEDDAVTRTVTMTFNTPIENPVLHIDRLGGNYSAENGVISHFSNSTEWTLTTPGVTITRLSGNPQFIVNATQFYREPNVDLGTWPTIGGEADGTNGMNGTAAGSIQFNGVVTTLTFNVTGIGVEGTASDGIEMIFEADLSPIVAFTVDPNPNCGGLDVTTTNSSIVNDDLPITYEWSIDGVVVSSDFEPTITFPSTGTFDLTLTVSDGVCSSSATESVSVSGADDPSVTITSVSSDCDSPVNSTFAANATSDAGIASYSWEVTLPDGSIVTSDEATITVESGEGDLSATVTVVNNFGCDATATATLTAVDNSVEVLISDMIGCEGEVATQEVDVPEGAEITFDPAGVTLVDGTLSVTAEEEDVTYTYTVVNGACTSQGTFTVTSLSETFDVATDLELCAGITALLLSGLPDGYTIESTPAGSTTVVDGNVIFNGSDNDVVVTHTIVSTTGCEYTAITSVTIVEADPVTVDDDLAGCIGSTVTTTALGTPGATYVWSASGNISIVGPSDSGAVTVSIDGDNGGNLVVTCTSPGGCVSAAAVTVETLSPADVMISEAMEACVGETTSVSALGSDGSVYAWTAMGGITIIAGANAQSVDFTLDNSMGGELFVTVTSPDGCVAMDQISVAPSLTPDVELPDTIFACEGVGVELPNDPNFTYTYSSDCPGTIDDGVFTYPLAATGSGVSELFNCFINVEISAGDCTQSGIINVQVTPNPINPANTPLSQCEGDSVTLNDGSLDQFTYTWSASPGYLFDDPFSGSQVVSVTESTTFTVTATANDGSGCVFTEDIFVEYIGLPIVLDAPSEIDLCAGETFDGEIVVDQPAEVWCYYTYTGSGMQETTVFTGSGSTMTGSGAGTFVYPWMFSDSGSGSGFITKEIVSINGGCTTSIIIPVNIFDSGVFVNADDNNLMGLDEIFYCPGEEVTLVASWDIDIIAAEWFDANGNSVSTDNPWTFVPDMDGTYTVVVMLANGCSATTEVTLTSSAAMVEIISSTGTEYCPGEVVSLTADVVPEGAVVTWICDDPAGTTSMDNPLEFTPEGTVTCTATVMNGECEDSATITLTPFDGEVIVNPSASSICPDESVEMCVEPIDPDCTYLWSTGDTTPCITVSPDVSTEYTVTCTTADGCQATTTVTVTVADAPTVDATASPAEIELGDDSTLSVTNPDDACTYTWFDEAGNQIGTGTSITVTPDMEGVFNYTVVCTTVDGCTSQAIVTVTVTDMPPPPPCVCSDDDIYIPNTFSPNADDNNDLYNLYTPTGETITYEVLIVDRWGECMYRYDGTDFNAAWDGTYEGDQLNPDVYGYCVRWTCPCDPDVEYVKTGNITLIR